MTDEPGANDLPEHKVSDPAEERRRQVLASSKVARDTKGGATDIRGFPYHVVRTLVRQELVYSIAGLVVGLLCVIGGVVLLLLGVTGSVSWTMKLLGTESKLADASPGAVLFVVGLYFVFVTRYRVKVRK